MSEGLQDNAATIRHEETQRRGEMFMRALPIFLIPFAATIVVGLIVGTLAGGFPPSPDAMHERNPFVPLVVGAVFLIALIALVRFGRPNLSSVLLIGVWTLFTTLFGLTNGENTFWMALLIVPICAAGLLIDGFASITLAALATLLVISLSFLQWQGVVASPTEPPEFLSSYLPLLSAGFWTGIFWTIAALTYLLASNLQNALKSSRARAQELSALSASLEARVQAQTAALLEQSREAAVLEERSRVARDIHDTLAQGLTGIVVQLGAAQRAMQAADGNANADGAALEHLTLAQSMAREALAEARRSIWNLRAPHLERGELRDALAGLAERASRANVQVEFETRGVEWNLRAEVESALLRVAQEALVNVAKHANATRATVWLTYAPDAVRLVVHDNGVGLSDDALNDATRVTGPESGFGLLGMRERIHQWDGALSVTNDHGAKVEATIPRPRAERVAEK
ncbi:MAG: sensor histidine kinase [Chloroflexi bacterium]|nr:sensor histidine kinase [Chloroflexota bacterium]